MTSALSPATIPATTSPRVAVLIPCFNEALTVADVVAGFRTALPDAAIYVYDNNSTDETAARARGAGAIVRGERFQGKGNVVRRMFADIDADIYVLVDGDSTYHAADAPRLIAALEASGCDLVNGARHAGSTDAYRLGHAFGNRLLTGLVRHTFGSAITDMLSGYKVFSRRYVKTFPAMSEGFEIETELTVHALEMRMRVDELPTQYGVRPEGSHSKLKTYRDGFRILRLIGFLVKEERPLLFFGGIGAALAGISVALGLPIILEFLETGLVPRQPTALLATGVMVSAIASLSCGLVLDSVVRGRRELKRLAYLRYDGPSRLERRDASWSNGNPARSDD